MSQRRQASEYTRKGLALKTELKDTRGIATSLQQLGSIFRYGRHYDSALKYDQLALETDQKLGLKLEELNMDLEIGNVYRNKQDDSAAQRYFDRGRTLAVATGDSARVATFDAALIVVRNNNEDLQLTEQQLMNSVSSAARSNDMADLLIDYEYLSDHFANTGQTKKAFEYLKKYYEIADSLQDLNTQLQLRKMEGQYNVDKKEEEIALLKKDRLLSRVSFEKQKAVLTAQNAVLEKQKFFQYGALILAVLLLLIGLLVINRYRIVHQARRAIELEKIMSRSAAIMEKMDDIVWTINPQNDTMEQLLYRMKEFAGEILEPLNINYSFEANADFSSLKLDIGRRKDLYLIFKEAVNNAAKYSQCSNLHIRLRRDGDFLRLEITDDGKGFAAETAKSGNGLSNMRERAASMPAGLKIDSAPGQGTRIGLDLPIT